ncbi:hypothetical protein GQ53DRAFT_437239 [Thozetella sp. PMI_491]|nr:hypothetical protein GQ53DRAFT_437239 [Thozetella sp. PMI_491]
MTTWIVHLKKPAYGYGYAYGDSAYQESSNEVPSSAEDIGQPPQHDDPREATTYDPSGLTLQNDQGAAETSEVVSNIPDEKSHYNSSDYNSDRVDVPTPYSQAGMSVIEPEQNPYAASSPLHTFRAHGDTSYETPLEHGGGVHVMDDGQGSVSPEPFTEHLDPLDYHTDSDSQQFVTPLASAGFPTTPLHQSHSNLADELSQADEDHFGQDDASSGYELEDEHTTTVHGADELFNDDSNSDESTEGFDYDEGPGDEEHDDLPQEHEEHEEHEDDAQRDPHDQIAEQIVELPPVDNDDPKTAVPAMEPQEPLRQDPKQDKVEEELEEVPDVSHHESQSTPSLKPAQIPSTPEVSPLVLRHETPSSATNRGLAASRHNPQRPQTPPSQQHPEALVGFDPDNFLPRDVTNVSWHARNDSIPQSMMSESTLSSAPSSPIHSSLPVDNHEPVIRDSWSAPVHGFNGINDVPGRPRTDSQAAEYDPFKFDRRPSQNNVAQLWQRRESLSKRSGAADAGIATKESSHESSPGSSQRQAPQNSSASSTGSPGSVFQRMRNIFENPHANPSMNRRDGAPPAHFSGGGPDGASWSGKGSPVRSRPVSGIFYPVRKGPVAPSPTRDSITTGLRPSLRPSLAEDRGYDHPDDRLGGYLNEAEDDIDERSALLSAH